KSTHTHIRPDVIVTTTRYKTTHIHIRPDVIVRTTRHKTTHTHQTRRDRHDYTTQDHTSAMMSMPEKIYCTCSAAVTYCSLEQMTTSSQHSLRAQSVSVCRKSQSNILGRRRSRRRK